MMIRPHSIGNPWHRASISLLFFMALIFVLFWAAFESEKLNTPFGLDVLASIAAISFLLSLKGWFSSFPFFLKSYVLLIGAFVFLPIYFLTMTPIILAILITSVSFKYIMVSAILYFLCCFLWCFKKLKMIRKTLNFYNYFEKETHFLPCGLLAIRGESAKDIDDLSREFSKNGTKPKISFLIIIPLVVMSYPLQKLLAHNGGAATVFSFCGLFCFPLSMYVVSEMVCGFYIWIFCSRNFEKSCSKRIVLE